MKDKVAEYYEKNYKALVKRARSRLDNPDDAEEVVSEAVITVLRQVTTGALTEEDKIPNFFTTALKSRAYDLYRKNVRIGVKDEIIESGLVSAQQFEEDSGPEAVLEAEEESRHLVELIDIVPSEKKRKVLTRSLVYGQKNRQIAEELGITPQRVSQICGSFIKEFEYT